MPIIKSAQKRMRQEAVRRERNRKFKDELRNLTKELSSAVSAKDAKKTEAAHRKLVSKVDTAVKKNLMHKNTAARRKSAAARLAKSVGSTASAPKTPAKKKPAAKKTASKTTAKKPAAKKSTTKK